MFLKNNLTSPDCGLLPIKFFDTALRGVETVTSTSSPDVYQIVISARTISRYLIRAIHIRESFPPKRTFNLEAKVYETGTVVDNGS